MRILFLADTHLGLDMPERPRVRKRRRGPDFFSNFDRALIPALRGEVDLVVHGGDVFYRSRVRQEIVLAALARLRAVTDAGVPVVVVPGNHERSQIPCPLLWDNPMVHVFDTARSYRFRFDGGTICMSGFPYVRRGLRSDFRRIVEKTGWRDEPADMRILCIHHIVEGARVGPADYQFLGGKDVIAARDLPADFAGIFSGHIHRYQILSTDRTGRRLNAPVFYPGSTERTSFAEEQETKGYLLLSIRPTADGVGTIENCEFAELPARPMVTIRLENGNPGRGALLESLRRRIAEIPADSVVRVCSDLDDTRFARQPLTTGLIRSIAPDTMTVEYRPAEVEPTSVG